MDGPSEPEGWPGSRSGHACRSGVVAGEAVDPVRLQNRPHRLRLLGIAGPHATPGSTMFGVELPARCSFRPSSHMLCRILSVVSLLWPVPPREQSPARPSARHSTRHAERRPRWDPNDLRPATQRRQASSTSFTRATGVRPGAQASLEGNWLSRAVLGDGHAIASDRVGPVAWPENQSVRAYGMAPNPDPDQPPSWTVNCLACHMAEIDGVAYFGAGSKVLDERILADTVKLVTAPAGRYRLPRGGPTTDGAARPRGDGPPSPRTA